MEQNTRDFRSEAHGRTRRWARRGAAAGLALLLTASGGAAAMAYQGGGAGVSTASAVSVLQPGTQLPDTRTQPGTQQQPGTSQQPGIPPGTNQQQTTDDGTVLASDDQSAGVVLIETELGYQSAAAAGTGIVLTSDGLVLTNNHVIAGSTTVQVTIGNTGQTYEARVVGSDSTSDIAVLQLESAQGLETADLDQDEDLGVGDAVTAVGNGGGIGQLQAAEGNVTALDAHITTAAEGTAESESLNGLIEIDADIVSGYSGGALLDDEGEVVGVNTAASSGSPVITGYAVQIDDAMDIAQDIIAGTQTETNTLGYPAFLGVSMAPDQGVQQSPYGSFGQQYGRESSGRGAYGAYGPRPGSESGAQGAQPDANTGSGAPASGAVIAGVYEATPAADAGLEAGDTVTSVNGTAVTSGDELSEALDGFTPGHQVELTWTDAAGQSQTATVTLTEGPADWDSAGYGCRAHVFSPVVTSAVPALRSARVRSPASTWEGGT